MLTRFRSTFRQQGLGITLALVGIFLALGGTSVAADATKAAAKLLTGKQVKDSSLTTKDIKNGSLLKADFKAGQLPAGAQGPGGPQGPKGEAGAPGAKGETGPSTGPAGGALSGDYPNPGLANGAVTPAKESVRPAVAAVKTANQSIPSGPDIYYVNFESEAFDLGGDLRQSATPDRLIAPVDGIYTVTGNVCWASNATGRRKLELQVAKNFPGGSTGYTQLAPDSVPAVSGDSTCQAVSHLVSLPAGDWVRLQVRQDSGAPLDLLGQLVTMRRSGFTMAWVGPLG